MLRDGRWVLRSSVGWSPRGHTGRLSGSMLAAPFDPTLPMATAATDGATGAAYPRR